MAENCKQDLCILIKHFYNYLYLRVQRPGWENWSVMVSGDSRIFLSLSLFLQHKDTILSRSYMSVTHEKTSHLNLNVIVLRLLVSGAAKFYGSGLWKGPNLSGRMEAKAAEKNAQRERNEIGMKVEIWENSAQISHTPQVTVLLYSRSVMRWNRG